MQGFGSLTLCRCALHWLWWQSQGLFASTVLSPKPKPLLVILPSPGFEALSHGLTLTETGLRVPGGSSARGGALEMS